MDELFLDVTDLIERHLNERNINDMEVEFDLPGGVSFRYTPGLWAGHVMGESERELDGESGDSLPKWYYQMASHLASCIRLAIYSKLGFTTSAGISSNKLFAKLAASAHKPNDQTTLLPGVAADAFLCGTKLRGIPGIGHSACKVLLKHVSEAEMDEKRILEEDERDRGILDYVMMESENPDEAMLPDAPSTSATVGTTRQYLSRETLISLLGPKIGPNIYDLLRGIDPTPVVPSGWPTQISIEDSFQHCTNVQDVRARLLELGRMFVERVQEEEWSQESGWRRFARNVRLTIRRRQEGNIRAWSDDRESRSLPLPVSIFTHTTPSATRSQVLVDKTLLPLFRKMVGDKPFDLTLLNIAAVDFKKETVGRDIVGLFAAQEEGKTLVDQIDQEVINALPEEIRREILGSGHQDTPILSCTRKTDTGTSIAEFFAKGEGSGMGVEDLNPLPKDGRRDTVGHRIVNEQNTSTWPKGKRKVSSKKVNISKKKPKTDGPLTKMWRMGKEDEFVCPKCSESVAVSGVAAHARLHEKDT
ncbi:uncharacterized protein SPPG_03129 [Spizellomyces punctatus DAOM BR117]|uniref:UmuC domain-containing protein n=1 Tax=Spizellomyces punctatus (strain DAOM BR117) TaxID=645134 RepID=A0A0L0HJL7_SPIPD|nr:uncharacterized protein SPPG_03129 [Spizellomyces punctatus DAOM BR117]KND01317.1 hypothetical protein SPPG_03129 [Spizellomyces punctatus DAOM BR117]|eukprot:XP_016609356.1 hypothetical protein SPPG_03129 [Spizellomyces punctatus DAOM BR117]